MTETALTRMLGIQYPVIMAPMFLVSNTSMTIAALESGISAAIPAHNYRTTEELAKAIGEIRNKTNKAFGINLVVNGSNFKYPAQLKTCLELNVPYIITSLGNPKEVIDECRKRGIKVFCDVTNLSYAKKVESLGADGVIAVNVDAGGHAGVMKAEELLPLLRKHLNIPVISAGGVATGKHIKDMLELGADGVSVGTIFIASHESPVSDDYKNALIEYGAKDIIKTSRLSGSPLTVINTPYVQQIGAEAGFFEKLLLKNKWLKKYVKLFIALRGVKAVEKAAFSATYKTLWCAGPAIEFIKSIRSVKEICATLIREWKESMGKA